MDKHGKYRVFIGLMLTAVAVFALFSMVSFTPTDPGGGDWAPGVALRNWCGITGAHFSGFMVRNFGSASASFAVGLAVFWAYILLVGRQALTDAYLKIVGSLLLVVSVSALSALAGKGYYFASSVGSTISVYAGYYFGMPGALLVLGLAAALSLLLATDFMVVVPAGRALVGAVRFMRALVARSVSAFLRRVKAPERVAAPAARVTLPEEVASPVVSQPPAARPVAAKKQPKPSSPKPKSHQPKPTSNEEASNRLFPEGGYALPPLSLLDDAPGEDHTGREEFIQEKGAVLKDTLAEFGIKIELVGIETGPVITQYEIALAPGIKVTRVLALSDDIAMALKARSVRIVAPIPGRDSIGIEVPNATKSLVNLKSLLREMPEKKPLRLGICIGRDAKGAPLVFDLAEMPHLLLAGTTGSGKSVCINSVILSILMQMHPDDVKLLLVDPKMVELASFKGLPHLICPVVTDVAKATAILDWACAQMDQRYDHLAAVGVRHITRYNKLGPKGIREKLSLPPDAEISLPDKMPYVIIIIDELADLMMVAAKDIETSITRLAQKSRAVGIHLVLATQRPSVDVITGLIKSNLPARVSFKVFSRIDSRTILDQNGAEKLLGAGDMLFLPPAAAKLIRAQGTFVSDGEIRRVCDFVKEQATPDYDQELVDWKSEKAGSGTAGPSGSAGKDPLYDDAVRVVIENSRGSVSLLQRRLGIGYGRAARLIDQMAEFGILGPYQGSQAREVLYTIEQWDQMAKDLKSARVP